MPTRLRLERTRRGLSLTQLTVQLAGALVLIESVTGPIVDLAERINDTAEHTQRLQAVAERFKVDFGSVANAIQTMQQRLGDGKLDPVLTWLNLDVDEFRRLSPVEQYLATAEALAGIPDAATRAATAQDLHGGAAKRLGATYKEGVGDVDRWIKVSDQTHPRWTGSPGPGAGSWATRPRR